MGEGSSIAPSEMGIIGSGRSVLVCEATLYTSSWYHWVLGSTLQESTTPDKQKNKLQHGTQILQRHLQKGPGLSFSNLYLFTLHWQVPKTKDKTPYQQGKELTTWLWLPQADWKHPTPFTIPNSHVLEMFRDPTETNSAVKIYMI